ncbi:hypothetical protein Poly41_46260 [Novipirellula artificiosorum]|uniref:Uncharacterized protein n=1 Tax=Novipirellula artificiosorum TaxID=2528016 RepID=A0A5C6DCQ8_9BACT|nr:hypothetical protein Poly41_46260 [Novipirellula artificiosorum]
MRFGQVKRSLTATAFGMDQDPFRYKIAPLTLSMSKTTWTGMWGVYPNQRWLGPSKLAQYGILRKLQDFGREIGSF